MTKSNQNIKISDEDRRIIYRARRGLKELDIFIDPYVKHHFAQADAQEKQTFSQLMEEEDPDLLNWFIGQKTPDRKFEALIEKIKSLKFGS